MGQVSLLLLLVPMLLFASCVASIGHRDLAELAGEIEAADVVFLGEEHDNTVGHAQHFLLFRTLHRRTKGKRTMVLSMEMFERDVQYLLDAYLAGKISEKAFLAKSRPWPRYREHYRPFIEYAKAQGIPVIAANIPRRLASQVAKKGIESLGPSPFVARSTLAPRDRYWERFKQVMQGAFPAGSPSLMRFYRAQCIKDDTMAESIADRMRKLEEARKPRPLVVHIGGKFHSDERLGTVERLRWRRPELRIEVLTMTTMNTVAKIGKGSWLLTVPREPRFMKHVGKGKLARAHPGPGSPPLPRRHTTAPRGTNTRTPPQRGKRRRSTA